jgi:DNA-binding transcriptional LysR family regulator
MVTVASAGYVARHGHPRHLDALMADHWLVGYRPNADDTPVCFETHERTTGLTRWLPMRSRMSVNNSPAYLAACEAGIGLVQIPALSAAAGLAAGRLVEILPGWGPSPMPVTLLYPHRRHLPRRVRAFMDWLQPLLAGDAQGDSPPPSTL